MFFQRILAALSATQDRNIQAQPPFNPTSHMPDVGDMFMDFLELFNEDLAKCGVDLGMLLGAGPDSPPNPTGIVELFELSSPCESEDLKQQMRTAFKDFETCAGVDILTLDESMFSALLGVLHKCISAFTAMDLATMNMPEDCAIALLGNHPLGEILRDFLLHPSHTADCYTKLGEEVPSCYVDLWPSPLDGKAVATSACVNTNIEHVLVAQCLGGLETLDDCLPESTQMNEARCAKYIIDCSKQEDSIYVQILMMLPETLRGMPLPDYCQQNATPGIQQQGAEKYEAFRQTCASTGEALWKRLENEGDDPRDPALLTFEEFLNGVAAPSNNNNIPSQEPPMVGSQQEGAGGGASTEESASLVSESQNDFASTFGGGILLGIAIMAMAYCAFVVIRKRRFGGNKTGSPGFVELSTGRFVDNSVTSDNKGSFA